jgi:glycosyltransferase involved in cell wall biosynthesis
MRKSDKPGIPLISIITVTYNTVATIEATIKSVVGKKDQYREFIIIDGGSNDGTIEIIKKYVDYITYWISEPDKGIYDAMNKGWDYASINNHILFLGAGDTILQLPTNMDLNSDSVYFGDVILGNDRIYKGKADLRLRIGNTVHHQALLVPKKLHPQPPFNTKYKVYADFDFNQRLLKRKVNFIKIDPLESYVLPDGFSQNYKTMEWYYIIRNNYGLFYAVLGYIYYRFQMIRKKAPKI